MLAGVVRVPFLHEAARTQDFKLEEQNCVFDGGVVESVQRDSFQTIELRERNAARQRF